MLVRLLFRRTAAVDPSAESETTGSPPPEMGVKAAGVRGAAEEEPTLLVLVVRRPRSPSPVESSRLQGKLKVFTFVSAVEGALLLPATPSKISLLSGERGR